MGSLAPTPLLLLSALSDLTKPRRLSRTVTAPGKSFLTWLFQKRASQKNTSWAEVLTFILSVKQQTVPEHPPSRDPQ